MHHSNNVSLGLLLGLSVVFHLHGAHVVRATTLCHFNILQLGALRFVTVRRNAMLGSWGGTRYERHRSANISMGEPSMRMKVHSQASEYTTC